MTAPTAPVNGRRPASVVDVLARQALSLGEQSRAIRAGIDAFDAQLGVLLEAVRLLQDAEAERRAAATMRMGEEDRGPTPPPVFGRGPYTSPSADAAPEIPPIPSEFNHLERSR